jgi:hypothetical protein
VARYEELRVKAGTQVSPALERLYLSTVQLEQAFEDSAQAVGSFYAVLGQDMALQGAQVHVAELFSDATNGLRELQAIDLKAWAGSDFGLGPPAQASVMELAKVRREMQALGATFQTESARSHNAFGAMFDGVKTATSGLLKGLTGGNGLTGLMNNLGKGIVDGFGNIMSGGLTQVINMGVQLAFEGIKKIGGMIAGLFKSEESSKVNKPRDQFFEQFGGYDGLAQQLTETLIGQGVEEAGNAASNLIRTLYDADTENKFKSAQQAIASVFSASGRNIQQFREGTKGQYQDFGTGSLAMLHGKERVSTEAEGKAEAQNWAALAASLQAQARELKGLRRDLATILPMQTRAAAQLGRA